MWTPEEATQELLAVLPFLNRIVVNELRREMGEDTTMPQFRVLSYLLDGPLSLSELAKLRRVSLQSAGELVQSLVSRGWIARTPNPNDRRQSLLHLTEAGKSQYEKAQHSMMSSLTPLMANLTDTEMAAVQIALPALHRVLANLEQVGE